MSYYVSLDACYVVRKSLRLVPGSPRDVSRNLRNAVPWETRAPAVEYALQLAREYPGHAVAVDHHVGPATLVPVARFYIAKE